MENKIDYSKLNKITVKNQDELDAIPLDFKGRIYIEFGDCYHPAIVRNKYYLSVEARENSSVVALGNSSVEARENSSVEAWGNSSVVAWENSSVVAWENSSVVARENSSVVAWENSSVVANANVQVVDRINGGKIQISGNARIVHIPKNIEDFMNFYGIKHTKTKAVFYKAVRKIGDKYFSDRDRGFEYIIGENKTEKCDTDINYDCSYGIHISHLYWALDFGKAWDNLAILEVETAIKDIVLPKNSDGKVRTSKVKVLRELPLSECGLYGKMIEKRRSQI